MSSFGQRARTDLKTYWKPLVIIAAPILLCPLPICIPGKEANCAYVVLLMAIYWMTEALPLAITAFLPLILYPLFGVLSASAVSVQYLKDSNLVFFGSMLMALAVEESQLHRRIALHVLVRIGSSPRRLMLGFMLSTGFLSMWMSNTAATAMMVPLALAVMQELPESVDNPVIGSPSGNENSLSVAVSVVSVISLDEKSNKNALNQGSSSSENIIEMETPSSNPKKFRRACKGLLLSICYAANIGGTGTLTGTGSNIVLTGQLDSIYHSKTTGITFASWMAFAVPQMIIMLILAWLWLQSIFIGFKGCTKRQGQENSMAKALLDSKLHDLGPMRFAEKITLLLSVLLVFLWLFRDPGFMTGWGSAFLKGYVSDGTTAMFIGCLFFVIPTELPHFVMCFPKPLHAPKRWRALLTWELMQKKFSWSIVLLLGGGYAMAAGVEKSGLDLWISNGLSSLQTLPNYVFVAVSVILVTFLTEFSSNVAVASIFIPIGASMAELMKINPLYVIIPITVGCSFAFMLPVATPPNSIVFGAGMLRVVEMALAGFMMNIICIIILLINVNTYGYWLFDCGNYPSWAKEHVNASTVQHR